MIFFLCNSENAIPTVGLPEPYLKLFDSRNLSYNFTSPNRHISAARSAVYVSDSNLLKTNYGLSGLAPKVLEVAKVVMLVSKVINCWFLTASRSLMN